MAKFKTLIFTLGLVSLGACKEFDGILSLNGSTQIRDNKDRPQVLGAGSYTASVGAKNKKVGRFTIKSNRSSVNFDFALPPEIRDENYEGPFRLNANDIRQDFDIAGFIDVRVNTSGPFQRSMSCVYDTYQRRVCHVECFDVGDGGGGSNGGHGGGGGRGDHFDIRNVGASTLDHRSCREVCHYETHYIYGRYEEEYNITTRERVCEFQLTDKNTRNQIGSFRGSQGTSSFETVLHRGYCHL